MVSDFAKESYLGGRAIVGPECVNGTGQVYVDVRGPHLSNAATRELVAALTDAADYASARQEEEER